MEIFILMVLIAGSYADNCYSVPGPIHPKENLSVPEAFKKYKILNDYLPEAPEDIFVGGHKGNEILLGSILSPLATTTPIHLSYPKGEKGVKYVAVLLGIDMPSPGPSKGAFINAMFANSPADNILKGDIVVPFSPPVPMLNSGPHRYVGLIYKQNDVMDVNSKDLLMLARYRYGFSAVDFARKYGLGRPVAGNFLITSLMSCDPQ